MKACGPTRGWRPQWRAACGLRLGWQRAACWLLLACCATPVQAQDYGPWRSLGPFEHSGGGTAVANAHAPDKLVGSWVAGSPGPDLAQAFKGQQGLELHWQLLPVAGDPRALDVGALDLKALLEATPLWQSPAGAWSEQAVVYLHRVIVVPSPLHLRVCCGSDDGLLLWLNGELLVRAALERTLDPASHCLEFDLQAGTNHLLVKIANGGGAWAFRLCAPPGIDQPAIDQAIERGVQWLLDNQLKDGSFGDDGLHEQHFAPRGGQTALALYALLKCKLPRNHPAVLRARAFLEAGEPSHTYALGTELMALDALEDPKLLPRIERLAQRLIELRPASNASWGYSRLASDSTDLSNTQYAALGLHAAVQAGAKIDRKLWSELFDETLEFLGPIERLAESARQKGSSSGELLAAGFQYRRSKQGSEPPSASMSTAGLCVLALCAQHLGQPLPPRQARDLDRARDLALAWLEQHFSVSNNPGGAQGWLYYWLYGLERVGGLLGLARLGERDWYAQGAQALVQRQEVDGGWRLPNQVSWPPEPLKVGNTCFALLFLARATAPTSAHSALKHALLSLQGPDQPVWLHARAGAQSVVWFEKLEPLSALAASVETPEGRQLFVKAVEFWVDGKPTERISAAPGPWAGQRIETRITFDRNGQHTLQARVLVRDDAAPGGERAIESGSLVLEVDDCLEDWMLEYARAGAQSLALEATASAKASSTRKDSAASYAFDGFEGRVWCCEEGDARPELEASFEPAPRVAGLSISQLCSSVAEREGTGRILRIEVLANGGDYKRILDLDPDPLRRTELRFEKPIKLRQLVLRVLAREAGRNSDGTEREAVGFAEILLLRP